MFYIYLIQSERFGRFYIGITADVQKRLEEHNRGFVRSTKAYRPYRLVHVKVFQNKTAARKREIALKRKGQEKEKFFRNLGYNRK
jgi:putative endonuclease